MPTFEMKVDTEDKSKFEISMKENQIERIVHSEGMPDDEKTDDHAYLSKFYALEECDAALAAKILAFECSAAENCTLGNPKDRTPGTYPEQTAIE
ncbi:hypothetical protein J6590_003358 [Homalodisca vitripennis]|nr:hypothetical protein J6590_003358 [Homalodisca vitripennis]